MNRVKLKHQGWWLGIVCFIGFGCSSLWAIPVSVDASQSSKQLEEIRKKQKFVVMDLMKEEVGRVIREHSDKVLKPGNYRLRAFLSLSSTRHDLVRDMELKLMIGEKEKFIPMWRVAGKEQRQEFHFDFRIKKAKRVIADIKWVMGDMAKLARGKVEKKKLQSVKVRELSMEAEEEEDELGGDDLELEQEGSGLMNLTDAKNIEHRVVLHGVFIERRPAIRFALLESDKVLYKPAEKGVARLVMRNDGTDSVSGRLRLSLRDEEKTIEVVHESQVKLAAGKSEKREFPFRANGKWGKQLVAEFTGAKGESVVTHNYFSVHDDWMQVLIGHASVVMTQRKNCFELLDELKGKYSNSIDLFFWAPCDWSSLVPDRENWWGGQASYAHNEKNLKSLVGSMRGRGIKTMAYCSRIPAGPKAWKLARSHPEWFPGMAEGGAWPPKVEHLDKWNDPTWRKTEPSVSWMRVAVDLRQLPALDFGIDQIISSVKHYGWDGVRFDGHYTVTGNDEISTRNMRRLKERVWKEFPDFRFGFNYGRAPEYHGGMNHEIREAMAGGGMYMQEGITNWRNIQDQYKSWKHYSSNELRIAKLVQKHGGTYHCIWSLGDKLNSAQNLYKLVYGLIAGGHPVYGTHNAAPGSSNWGAFLTLSSRHLWDTQLVRIMDAKQRFVVNDKTLQWRELAQERVIDAKTKSVVLHLVNPPSEDSIDTAKLPHHVSKAFEVAYRPRQGEKVMSARLYKPDGEPFVSSLPISRKGDEVWVKVPSMSYWSMVTFEVKGNFTPLAMPPKFTEKPDAKKVAQAMRDKVKYLYDPNKDAVEEDVDYNNHTHYFNHKPHGGLPNTVIVDKEAELGRTQYRSENLLEQRLGAIYFAKVHLGRWRVKLRLKWTDENPVPAEQRLVVHIEDHFKIMRRGKMKMNNNIIFTSNLVTPGHSKAPKNAITLGPKGKYQEVEVGVVTLVHKGLLNINIHTSTSKKGKNAVYIERVHLEALEKNDRELEKYYKLVEKPDSLRQPQGRKPKKILLVKGLYWQKYVQGLKIATQESYSAPVDHEGLYAHDAIVLANVDMRKLTLPQRKIYSEYVEDGGRLVILGGCFSLGRSHLSGTYLGELLPVDCRGPSELKAARRPLLLGPAKGKSFDGQPKVFWHHFLKVKSGDRVETWAGDHPALVKGERKKGLVAVFAGSTLGRPSKGETPFWKWKGWSKVLESAVYQ